MEDSFFSGHRSGIGGQSPLTADPRPLTTPPLRVAVVGPCASGKSTLAAALRAAGYEARQPAQEHSYVPDMWQRLVDPDVLIYLDISYEALIERRPFFGEPEYLEREKARLAHARAHADVVIDTSQKTAEEVWAKVVGYLGQGDASPSPSVV